MNMQDALSPAPAKRVVTVPGSPEVTVAFPSTGDVVMTVIGEEHLPPVVLTDGFAHLVSLGVRHPACPGSETLVDFACLSVPDGTVVLVDGHPLEFNEVEELVSTAVQIALRASLTAIGSRR